MVAVTMYVYVVPFLYHTQHPLIFAMYFIYGNYLLVMICFNYFSGVYTKPGSAPKVEVRIFESNAILMLVLSPVASPL